MRLKTTFKMNLLYIPKIYETYFEKKFNFSQAMGKI